MSWLPPEDIILTADYVYKKWLESPVIKHIFASLDQEVAHAANTRLASAMAQLRNASLLSGAGGLALTAGVPLAAWVGIFVALGAPYAQAQTLVRDENFQSGFSQGFVTGLLKWQWDHTVTRFGRFSPDFNVVDNTLGFISANARNEGLRSGFLMAGMLPGQVKKNWLSKLRDLSPGTKPGHWDRADQISYVIDLASAGRRNGIFK